MCRFLIKRNVDFLVQFTFFLVSILISLTICCLPLPSLSSHSENSEICPDDEQMNKAKSEEVQRTSTLCIHTAIELKNFDMTQTKVFCRSEPCRPQDAVTHPVFLLQFPHPSAFCIVLCPDCCHGFSVARTTARCFTSTTCRAPWPRTCWGNASRFSAKQRIAKSSSATSEWAEKRY